MASRRKHAGGSRDSATGGLPDHDDSTGATPAATNNWS